MKGFIIGFILGVVLASSGTYAIIAEKAKKAATKENAEKVAKATQEFGSAIKEVFE